jgi:hypothetical protein
VNEVFRHFDVDHNDGIDADEFENFMKTTLGRLTPPQVSHPHHRGAPIILLSARAVGYL